MEELKILLDLANPKENIFPRVANTFFKSIRLVCNFDAKQTIKEFNESDLKGSSVDLNESIIPISDDNQNHEIKN